jgi:type II secretory pathway component GspD/PulD (secretin)
VRTTVSIPDGGTLLLGGQTIDEVRNESAGVPILRDIPVLGFFFDRIGKSVTKRRLLILLRVKIVIPTEAEPRLPQDPSPLLRGSSRTAQVR